MTTCPECARTYNRKRSDQVFCSTACNKVAGNRALKRCAVLYSALYWWRFDRKRSARDALRFICREIRDWIEEDADEGRLPPPKYDAGRPQGHERKVARRSRGLPLTALGRGEGLSN